MRELHIDFETYSEAKITGPKAIGAWAYSRHPSTIVLMMAWAFDDDEPQIWLPGEDLPNGLNWLNHGDWKNADGPGFQINAQNDFFELCIMLNVLGWVVPSPKYWYDVAADFAALALPRALGDCGDALGLDVEDLKDPEGKKLIDFFCSPVTKKKQKVRRMPGDHPEKFEAFKRYCIQDPVAHRAVKRRIRTIQPLERLVWELDRKINLRGVRFDMDAVRHAIVVRDKAKAEVLAEVEELTGGRLKNVGSRAQLMDYMEFNHGIELENGQKEYLSAFAEELPEGLAKRILELRLSYSKSSLAKYDKLIEIVDPDTNRAYGLLRYHGASTGRWSGNLFQPQNLPRPSFDDTDRCISLLHHEDVELIGMFYGDVLESLSSCLRGMIIASEGCRLVVSDLSQIESRMLGWLAGDEKKMQSYRDGLDIYKVNAAAAFGVPYEKVTKYQRSIGKVIELACGYQGSIGAFNQFAKTLGVVIEESLAKELIKAWRFKNPKVVSYWSNVEATVIKAIEEPGTVQDIGRVSYKVVGRPCIKKWKGQIFKCPGEFLYCKLPSGRVIAYHKPHLVEGKFGKDQMGFFGVDSKTKKYTHKVTYGGCLVENITQAASRCKISDASLELEDAGYCLVLSVHDELIGDTPIGHGSLEEFNYIMKKVPKWAPGLPIDAAGYESQRYKKD